MLSFMQLWEIIYLILLEREHFIYYRDTYFYIKQVIHPINQLFQHKTQSKSQKYDKINTSKNNGGLIR